MELLFFTMAVATHIREQIKTFSEGKTFGYDALSIDRANFAAAAKALERLQKEGVIKKASKGVFYKPKRTTFGELKPDYNELLRPYLFENGKRVAYVTGPALYNSLGLTTQVAFRIKIASRAKRIVINRGPLKADAVKSYAEVNDKNYQILGLLDAFKDIKHIPDCSVEQGINRLGDILKSLNPHQTTLLINYALFYPPRVRALVGAILETLDISSDNIQKLKDSLNPFTTITLGISRAQLPSKSQWNIE
jgi:hypothetical protein